MDNSLFSTTICQMGQATALISITIKSFFGQILRIEVLHHWKDNVQTVSTDLDSRTEIGTEVPEFQICSSNESQSVFLTETFTQPSLFKKTCNKP